MQTGQYYFVEGGDSYSQLSTLGLQLVNNAEKRYKHAVVSSVALHDMVANLKEEAEQLWRARSRCRKPKVSMSDGMAGKVVFIHIDEWCFLCRMVRGIYDRFVLG